jgi:hypothetical protein
MRSQPKETENERAQIKKWCKLPRNVKAKRQKQTGVKQGRDAI